MLLPGLVEQIGNDPLKIKKNDTVIILGTAGTLNVAPWDLPDNDYWACQPVITYPQSKGHRIDALFEIHKMETWKVHAEQLNEFTKTNVNTPVFMAQPHPSINNSVKFPIEQIQEMVKENKYLRKYFTSTIAYMIACAIWMGYKAIELYGVHMSCDEEEYSGQRNCCEAWLNYGYGKGINYWIPDESDIMACGYMYGYEQEKGFLLELYGRADGLQNGVNNLNERIRKLTEERDLNRGAVLDCQQLIQKYKRG